jgi:Tfp pilus assembly protein PilV
MWRSKRSLKAFALYEVLLGLAIFAVGVLALGRSVQNCLNASALSSEDNRVRQILADRMAEIQATPGFPDANKETKVATGYGDILLVQKSAPAGLKVQNNAELNGINLISLSAVWKRGGVSQTRKIQFYVYRNG